MLGACIAMDKALERPLPSLRRHRLGVSVVARSVESMDRPDVLPARVQQCLWANMYSGSASSSAYVPGFLGSECGTSG